ncbi:TraR/DksA C4-type zinc finger protein [Desulfocurvibacter africanus]|uniref:TraR/DksA C4-type zinc finger protein n=1 Tax=Desulfocurvibacter africanus TaxID=873 RepID=UPI0003FD4AAD|nr:TraR/DksA C4-type zinc finger protein [Desulfocurvibacter africanus]
MDEADLSQRAEELFLAEALARRAGSESLGPVIIAGVPCCRECEQPIPSARLAAVPGVGLCVECQRLLERS